MGHSFHQCSDDIGQVESASRRQNRELEEGIDAHLAAVTVPQPVSADQLNHESIDNQECRADAAKVDGGDSEDGDQFLSEVAAPKPVQDEEDLRNGSLEKSLSQSTKRTTQSKRREQYTTQLYVLSWLIFFSFLGTLARLGVEALTTYPNTPFPSTVLWANLGGCFIMGFLVEDRSLFRSHGKDKSDEDHAKFKKGLPLYVGLSTGFCGSFTSFSSFITDAFLALTNDLPNADDSLAYRMSSTPIQSRNGGYSVMAVLAILIVQPAVSFAAFVVGAHTALASQPFIPTSPAHMFHRFLDPIGVVLAFGCWIGAIMLAVWPQNPDWRPRAVFPLVFAPLGTLCRFYASKYLNGRIPWFPLGTFVANIAGTCIEGTCYDLKYTLTTESASPGGNMISCGVLSGLMEGFCGCLTTVSTWMAELNSLERKHRYLYGLSTVWIALGFQVIIMGSVGWTIGFGKATCDI